MAMFPVFVFSSLYVCSAVVISIPPTQSVQLGHFHTYTPTGKHTVHYTNIFTYNDNRIHSGVLQLVLGFCVHSMSMALQYY